MGNWCSYCFSAEGGGQGRAGSNEPDERTRLLDGDTYPVQPEFDIANHANSHSLNQLREQESLKRIVQKTADHLIDISAIRTLDRIQHELAVERAQEYDKIVQQHTAAFGSFRRTMNMLTPTTIRSQEEVLSVLKAAHVNAEDVAILQRIGKEVGEVLDEMKVNDVGEFVVKGLGM
ncbi:hypothetical protein HDU85_000633 [Gaertneriomyces sp. JEL0708]|nr:hypothetical protein HDU85_000633 [Gaertneriomyces sp. JEL0708]